MRAFLLTVLAGVATAFFAPTWAQQPPSVPQARYPDPDAFNDAHARFEAEDAARGKPEKTWLYTEVSVPGETIDAFVVRVAPRALKASRSARAMLCGEIIGARLFQIYFKTDGYVSTCDVPKSTQPYVLVNGTAVDARENHFSQENWKRRGYLVTPWSVKHQDGISEQPRTLR